MKKYSALIKFFDIILALVLLPLALTAFLLMLAPQLICFGKIFHKSIRTGKDGKNFIHIKLKSMREAPASSRDILPAGGRAHLEKWRIPLWGRILRKTHLDEIPEIFSILIGAESFVGPRPLLPEHVALVDSPERQSLKPGWTGYSQIFLKTRSLLPSRIQRRLDQKLGRDFNPKLYLKILWATIFMKKKKPLVPGPTIISYRRLIQSENENS